MLKAIICGMEHSGTTLLSDLLRQTGTMESGFEVGVLLTDSPQNFETISPYYENMLAGWKISRDQLEFCCNAAEFTDFYGRLKDVSPLIKDGVEIFDKTPRYATEVLSISEKIEAPIIQIFKDPRSSVYSDFKRADTDAFDEWFEQYAKQKRQYMRRCYNGYRDGLQLGERFLSFSLEQLCFAARETAAKLYQAVGEEFKPEYLLMENLRYQNTRAKFVSADIILEYKMGLSADQIRTIEQEFSEFDEWFYE